jgi:hypothetical protein
MYFLTVSRRRACDSGSPHLLAHLLAGTATSSLLVQKTKISNLGMNP